MTANRYNQDNRNPHPINVYVGERLKKFRRKSGLSQRELGRRLRPQITFQQIQKYEKGQNRISSSSLWGFCQILNVMPNDFFPDENADEKDDPLELILIRHSRTIRALDSLPEPARRIISMLIAEMVRGYRSDIPPDIYKEIILRK